MAYRVALKEGSKWILIFLLVMLAAWAFLPWNWYWVCLKLLSTVLFVFVVAFFRNPERKIPEDPDAIVAPADGEVIKIWDVDEAPLIRTPSVGISIFMSVFNVHINRIPASGIVENIDYRKGQFLVASKPEASEKNERNAIVIRTDNGERLVMVQVAGTLARRIICNIGEGDRVVKGWSFGMIVLGSRVDLFLPKDAVEIRVKIGDKVRAGSSIIGYWR
ncbi:MAG TPA: phosphatidylserine decarboxylase family protein [Proteobacteria bacterium]|nr:phosphatidylserine decarboxylase family protein [Pseudomonadota bacterium]